MTGIEAEYWKRFINKVIVEKLEELTVSEEDALRISTFAERFMILVDGQQPLPQGVFREFLDIFKNIPQIQAEIVEAQEKINQFILEYPTEVPKKQVEEMFNGEMWEGDDWMWLPSMDVDANGNVTLNIVVDEEGNATFIDD